MIHRLLRYVTEGNKPPGKAGFIAIRVQMFGPENHRASTIRIYLRGEHDPLQVLHMTHLPMLSSPRALPSARDLEVSPDSMIGGGVMISDGRIWADIEWSIKQQISRTNSTIY